MPASAPGDGHPERISDGAESGAPGRSRGVDQDAHAPARRCSVRSRWRQPRSWPPRSLPRPRTSTCASRACAPRRLDAEKSMRDLDVQIARYMAQRKAVKQGAQAAKRDVKRDTSGSGPGHGQVRARRAQRAAWRGSKASTPAPTRRPLLEATASVCRSIRREIRIAEAPQGRPWRSSVRAQTRVVARQEVADPEHSKRQRKRGHLPPERRRRRARLRIVKQMTGLARINGRATRRPSSSTASRRPSPGPPPVVSARPTAAPASTSTRRAARAGTSTTASTSSRLRHARARRGRRAWWPTAGWNPWDQDGRAWIVVRRPPRRLRLALRPPDPDQSRARRRARPHRPGHRQDGQHRRRHGHPPALRAAQRRQGRQSGHATCPPAWSRSTRPRPRRPARLPRREPSKAAKATPTPRPTPRPKPSKTLKYPTVTWDEYEAFELCPDAKSDDGLRSQGAAGSAERRERRLARHPAAVPRDLASVLVAGAPASPLTGDARTNRRAGVH